MLTNDKRLQWEEKFRSCLAMEFSDPDYFEVHHLLVLTYMLQTNGYSVVSRNVALDLLGDFLRETMRPREFRIQFNALIKQYGEKHKITNDSSLVFENYIKCEMDILDVDLKNAAIYCNDIRTWATLVYKELWSEA